MSASSIAIIDYGMGNLHSVSSALAHVSPESHIQISSDPDVINQADKLIFPGVGAIRDCMGEIRRLHFDTIVPDNIASGKPVLAICVGMQALTNFSEENNGVDCIGLFDGAVRFFGDKHQDADGNTLKVPHMGWNQVKQEIDHPLWHGIEDNSRFYFVHSYFVELADKASIAAQTTYGNTFTSALSRDNLFATQFHPEKSDKAGLQLLRNFIAWKGD